MKSIITTYPDFQSLPKGIKRMLVASECFFFLEANFWTQKPRISVTTTISTPSTKRGTNPVGRYRPSGTRGGTRRPEVLFEKKWRGDRLKPSGQKAKAMNLSAWQDLSPDCNFPLARANLPCGWFDSLKATSGVIPGQSI
jgi:hypothetical protein